MFDELIDKNKELILKTLCDLIKFPSISIENTSLEYPFGKGCSDSLNYILNLAKNMGFKTKNIDGYCGYIEFGEGKELVGIVGHLDVVPALKDDGWTTPPFEPTIRNGKLYGRGAIDDKGPVVASLYAMKSIMDNVKLSKRVRLILGLNEEKDWKCINYYKTHEEIPSIGFSPDANFPAIYAEKGILSIELKNTLEIIDYDIIEISCNNNALNVVPKYCSIILKPNTNAVLCLKNSDNIKVSNIDKNLIKIESFGIASHAAHPEEGKNAITNLIKYLIKNFKIKNDYLGKLNDLGIFNIINPDFLNCINDESGMMTSNIAFVDYNKNYNSFVVKINLRVPVSTSLDSIIEKYKNLKSEFENLEVVEIGRQNPLFVDKNSYLVKTLVDIFNKKTNMNELPIAIGGGTYARAFNNFVSYGMTMPGDKDMCHQVDEYIEIDKLIISTKIYAEAIYALAK